MAMSQGMSVLEAVQRYMDALHEARIPEGTMRTRRTVLYRLGKTYRHRKYRGLTRGDLSAFLYGPGGILVKVESANTRSVYRSSLKRFFEYGEDQGWGPGVELPRPGPAPRAQRRESPPTRLTEPVLVQLLETCSDDPAGRVLRCMLAVAMNTAWRVSDIRRLRVSQIDLVGGNLNFVSQKTGKPDAFPLSLDLDEELRAYVAWYAEAAGVTWSDSDAYLFPAWNRIGLGYKKGFAYTPNPEGNVSYSWALRQLQQLLATSGVHVERREAWHVVRRSVARIYFDSLKGEMSYAHALRQTASLLQHDETATTEKYLGLSTEKEARDQSLRGKRFIGIREQKVVPFQRRVR